MDFDIYVAITLGSVGFLIILGIYNVVRYKLYRALMYSVGGFVAGVLIGLFFAGYLLSGFGLPPSLGLGGALFLILLAPIPIALGLICAVVGAFIGRRIDK